MEKIKKWLKKYFIWGEEDTSLPKYPTVKEKIYDEATDSFVMVDTWENKVDREQRKQNKLMGIR